VYPIYVRGDIAASKLEPAFKDWAGNSAPLHAVYPGTGPRPLRVRVRRFVEFLMDRLGK
jgi:hypothetical protein